MIAALAAGLVANAVLWLAYVTAHLIPERRRRERVQTASIIMVVATTIAMVVIRVVPR